MILVTGSNGFVGKSLVDALRARSNDLKLLGRSKANRNKGLAYYQREINSRDSYRDIISGCEAIIHCAALVPSNNDVRTSSYYREVNTLGTLNLARQAAESGVKRFVFVSSIKACGESTPKGGFFESESECKPASLYGRSKRDAEIGLLDIAKSTGLEVVIVRPTLVYGPGAKGNFDSLMRLTSKRVPLPFGAIKHNQRSLVYIGNLVDLLIKCIDHPSARNQIFLVSDDRDVSTSDLIFKMNESLGIRQLQLPIPELAFRLFGSITGKQDVVERLVGSLRVDIAHTKNTLSWRPPLTLERGFYETAHALLNCKK